MSENNNNSIIKEKNVAKHYTVFLGAPVGFDAPEKVVEELQDLRWEKGIVHLL